MEKDKNSKGNIEEQNEKLKEMNYSPKEDIFNNEDSIPLDINGKPLSEAENTDTIDMGLNVPGSELDNKMEKIGEEDEENNYYSGADQD